MEVKKLKIGNDLREYISYGSHYVPLAVCVDHFDDYFRREWGCHWHDEIEFGVVQKGIIQFTIYNEHEQFLEELHPGEGIFINSGCLHSVKALVPDSVMSGFTFPITFFDKQFGNTAYKIISPVTESGVIYSKFTKVTSEEQELLSSIEEICRIDEQEITHEVHFIELLCKIWRLLTIRILQNTTADEAVIGSGIQEQRVKQILSFIHEHYSEHISIDDIAYAIAISRTECFRCFQTILKTTPIEYLKKYRLSMATMLLESTKRTISDIAFSCGYNNLSYFGKVFREQNDVSPQAYRKRLNIN